METHRSDTSTFPMSLNVLATCEPARVYGRVAARPKGADATEAQVDVLAAGNAPLRSEVLAGQKYGAYAR